MRDLFDEKERWKKVADDYLNKFLNEKKSVGLDLRVQRQSVRLEGLHKMCDDLSEEHDEK
ncbi:hypothetical protein FRX31_023498 [Thalictrum thalictroides]|uniref:Uncharacterized protein n=1 Tax=Thalictrum thalictroides TaxID=46969 RepID=A0A7J6VRQ4_THATH|nr:hypothetical protein FRX31_023498 [Thalictrum thalictroides]